MNEPDEFSNIFILLAEAMLRTKEAMNELKKLKEENNKDIEKLTGGTDGN